jgi:hypothetical protein
MRRCKDRLSITALTLGGALLLGAAARAAEPIQVSGRMTCKTPEQHTVVQKVTCSGSASGRFARFDGGQQTWVEADDLIKGSGMIHGYEFAKYKDGSTGVTNYAGAQVTTMINGKPEWRPWGRGSRRPALAA